MLYNIDCVLYKCCVITWVTRHPRLQWMFRFQSTRLGVPRSNFLFQKVVMCNKHSSANTHMLHLSCMWKSGYPNDSCFLARNDLDQPRFTSLPDNRLAYIIILWSFLKIIIWCPRFSLVVARYCVYRNGIYRVFVKLNDLGGPLGWSSNGKLLEEIFWM